MMGEFEFKKMYKLYHWLMFQLVAKRKIKKNIKSIVTGLMEAGLNPDEAATRTCEELNRIDNDGVWSITRTK